MIETIAPIAQHIRGKACSFALDKVFDILWQKVAPKDDVENAVDAAFRKAMHEVFSQRDYREVMTPEFRYALEQMIMRPNVLSENEDEDHNRVFTLFMQYLAESAPFASQYVHEIKSEARYNDVISLLFQLINASTEKKTWENVDNMIIMFYATLLGGWNSTVNADKELISNLCGLRYEDFELRLAQFLEDKDFPITCIGKIWQVKSPYTQMQKYARYFTPAIQDKVKACVDWLMEDDDPDAKAKMDADEMKYWEDKHVFSSYLKEGIFRGITALSVILENQGASTGWIDDLIASKLREFGLVRYLSNRSYLEWFSESSPSAFISFLENEIHNDGQLFDIVFKTNKKRSILGGGIYYPELLFCLEKLAWNEQCLPQVTEILLHFCNYPTDSGYVNSAKNSLDQIYRFLLPQTMMPFKRRLEILRSLSARYPEHVYALCYRMLDGIDSTALFNTSHFKWRWAGQYVKPKSVRSIPADDVIAITRLMLELCPWTALEMAAIIELSSNRFMSCSRELILSAIKQHVDIIKGIDDVVERLRKDIIRHQTCKGARWALEEEHFKPYMELLSMIESQDIIKRNKHYFDEYIVREPDIDNYERDFPKKLEESREIRKSVLLSILDELGIDGVWQMQGMAKNPESVARALLDTCGTKYCKDVFQGYVNDFLSESFVKAYFHSCYFDDKDKYLGMVTDIAKYNLNRSAILYYAPEYKTELANVIASMPNALQDEYWKKVTLWGYTEHELPSIVERIRSVGRYSDVLRLVAEPKVTYSFTDAWKIELLYEMLSADAKGLVREAHFVAEIVKTLCMPTDEDLRTKLFNVEFLLQSQLRYYLRRNESHFERMINTEPEMMMQLVDIMYLPDEEYRQKEELTDAEKQNKLNMAQFVWDFFFHYHDVPCSDNGIINEDALRKYIERLKQLAEEHHRKNVIGHVIGKIVGNFPEDDNYPSDFMCNLVEDLNDRSIDDEIGRVLSNRRGMSSRGCFDGGDIERGHITRFKTYRSRALMKSPRMVEVFDREIKSFEHKAESEDNRAALLKLKYGQ